MAECEDADVFIVIALDTPRYFSSTSNYNRHVICWQKISMADKPIRAFQRDAFLGLRSLKMLILYDCDLQDMPLLDPTKSTLEDLDLTCNDLVFIERDYFLGFRRLIFLGLSRNRHSTTPDITPLAGTLEQFEMTNNVVVSLNPYLSHANYTKHAYLDVSRNNISELTSVIISQCPMSRFLDIEHNSLLTLEDMSGITREFPLEVIIENNGVYNTHTAWQRPSDDRYLFNVVAEQFAS